jgi:hypothetical protein
MRRAADAVLAEDVPSGTFGAARSLSRDSCPAPWTPAEQDSHWQALCHTVGATGEERPRLRPVTQQPAA